MGENLFLLERQPFFIGIENSHHYSASSSLELEW